MNTLCEPVVVVARAAEAEAAFKKTTRRLSVSDKKAKKAARDGRPLSGMNTVVTAQIFRRDVRVKVKVEGLRRKKHKPTRRGEIKGFSFDSARRLRFLLRNTRDMWDVFLTLTYPSDYPSDGREVKRHVNAFCQFLRRRKIAYAWVLEFQERGAPHFHFLLSGFVPKLDVSEAWYGIVGSGDIKHLHAGTRIEAIKNQDHVGAYMDGYVSKIDQKTVPDEYKNVGRFWGASRCLSAVIFHVETVYSEASRQLRVLRAAQKASTRHFAEHRRMSGKGFYKWRWSGFGFCLIDGAGMLKRLLAQAILNDGCAWKEGEPERAALKYVPHYLRGQLLLGGGLAPEDLPDFDAPGISLREPGAVGLRAPVA